MVAKLVEHETLEWKPANRPGRHLVASVKRQWSVRKPPAGSENLRFDGGFFSFRVPRSSSMPSR
jgi:hypothetical protein